MLDAPRPSNGWNGGGCERGRRATPRETRVKPEQSRGQLWIKVDPWKVFRRLTFESCKATLSWPLFFRSRYPQGQGSFVELKKCSVGVVKRQQWARAAPGAAQPQRSACRNASGLGVPVPARGDDQVGRRAVTVRLREEAAETKRTPDRFPISRLHHRGKAALKTWGGMRRSVPAGLVAGRLVPIQGLALSQAIWAHQSGEPALFPAPKYADLHCTFSMPT